MSIQGTRLNSMVSLSSPIVWIGSQQCLIRTVTASKIDCIVQALSAGTAYAGSMMQVPILLGHPPAPNTPTYYFTFSSYNSLYVTNTSIPPIGGFNTSGGGCSLPAYTVSFVTLAFIFSRRYAQCFRIWFRSAQYCRCRWFSPDNSAAGCFRSFYYGRICYWVHICGTCSNTAVCDGASRLLVESKWCWS